MSRILGSHRWVLVLVALSFAGCSGGLEIATCANLGLDCGSNGRCVDEGDTVVCACDPGYAGSRCERCADTHQDTDGNGSCEPTCETMGETCSNYGACVYVLGLPGCSCGTGYEGASCADCAAGYQDHDADGTCNPMCELLQCQAQEVCDDSDGLAECLCAPGFEREQDACVWRGVVLDPNFQNTPEVWAGTNGAVVDLAEAGHAEPGAGLLPTNAACQTGRLQQSVVMPALSQSGPLRLSLFESPKSDPWTFGRYPHLKVSLGNSRMFAASKPGAFREFEFCLGEGAMAGMRSLAVSSTVVNRRDCVAGVFHFPLLVDNLEITPDPACPVPGEVKNGNFEAEGGWLAVASRPAANEAAGIENGAGLGGTRGGVLSTTTFCTGPALTGQLSIPTQANHAALEFSAAGTAGKDLDLYLEGFRLTRITGSGAFAKYTVCLPEGFKGSAPTISFQLPSTSGACADPDVRRFVIDDMKLVEDPTCPASAGVLNPGFERAGVDGWALRSLNPGKDEVRITTDEARSGSSSLHMKLRSRCDGAVADTLIQVPKSEGNAGPAVKFWYKRRGSSTSTATFRTSLHTAALPFTTAWTLRTECLDPAQQGDPLPLTITGSGGGGVCSEVAPDEDLWIDDLIVGVDPACPAQ